MHGPYKSETMLGWLCHIILLIVATPEDLILEKAYFVN